MSNKWVNPQPKLVPQPYTNLLTERDIGRPPILETQHLGIDFGGLTAVADFNLAIGRTEITGLIGPNGAGKTTIFNLLTNVYKPTRGSTAFRRQGRARLRSITWASPVPSRISVCSGI